MNNTLTQIDKLIEEAKERKTNHELVIGDNLSSRFNFGFASGCVYEINQLVSQLTQLKTVIQGSYSEEEGWISVSEKLPEFDVNVLVFGEAKGMNPRMGGAYQFITTRKNLKGTLMEKDKDRYLGNNEFYAQYVTHWRKLPQPPITKTN